MVEEQSPRLRMQGVDARWEAFLGRANDIHGDRYGYDEARKHFVNDKEPIPIWCNEHQRLFPQPPKEHKEGAGCPDCSGRRGASSQSRFETFAAKAGARHGYRYVYDESSFFTAGKDPVTIFCTNGHGWFAQRADKHKAGAGCPDCSRGRYASAAERGSHWVELVTNLHDSQYDYSDVVYVDDDTKVLITCTNHPDVPFEQSPRAHSEGKGCPACGAILAKENRLSPAKEKLRKQRLLKE